MSNTLSDAFTCDLLVSTLQSLADPGAPEVTHQTLADAVGKVIPCSGVGEGKFSWLGGFTPVGRENEVISKAKISEAIKHVTDQSARRRRQNQKKKEKKQSKRREAVGQAHPRVEKDNGVGNTEHQRYPHKHINRKNSLRHSYSLDSAATNLIGSAAGDDDVDDVDDQLGYDSDTTAGSLSPFVGTAPARKRSGSFPPPATSPLRPEHYRTSRVSRGISKENADSFFRAILGAIYDERPATPESVEQLEIIRLRSELAALRAEVADIGKFLLDGVGDKDEAIVATDNAACKGTVEAGDTAVESGDDASQGGTPELKRKNANTSAGVAGLDRRTRASAWVYVLWDIENVSVPKQLNPKTGAESSGFKVAHAIRDFLEKKGILTSHTKRATFKLFYRPHALSVNEVVLKDLQRGDFELVSVLSRKPEAADRLIEHEINNLIYAVTEAHREVFRLRSHLDCVAARIAKTVKDNALLPTSVLDGGLTALQARQSTIVLISSDFDFKNLLKTAHSAGFRVVLIHGPSLEGDRKVSYMRDCHAKLYEWTDVMQKLVRETEVETQQRRTTAKATVHPGLEPLEEAQQVPLLEILAHAAKNTDATVATATIARHTLVELLNARLHTRNARDGPAITIIEGYDVSAQNSSCTSLSNDDSQLSQTNLLQDSATRNVLCPASEKPIRFYLKRAEATNLVTLNGNEYEYDAAEYRARWHDLVREPPLLRSASGMVGGTVGANAARMLSGLDGRSDVVSHARVRSSNSSSVTLLGLDHDDFDSVTGFLVPPSVSPLPSAVGADTGHSATQPATMTSTPMRVREDNGGDDVINMSLGLGACRLHSDDAIVNVPLDDGAHHPDTAEDGTLDTPGSDTERATRGSHSRESSIASSASSRFSVGGGGWSGGGVDVWSALEAPGTDQRKLVEWHGCSATITGTRTLASSLLSEYTVYVLVVTDANGHTYEIERRYSEFEALLHAMARCHFNPPLPSMPPKKLFNSNRTTIGERIKGFQDILDRCQELAPEETGPLLRFLSDS